MTGEASISRALAEQELWRQGVLLWLVREHQLPVYEFLAGEGEWTQRMAYVHRQFGKSFLACLIAVESCLRKPKARVSMVAPTQKMLRAILLPNMATLLETCPGPLRPLFNAVDNVYTFSNGSTIRLDGADGGNLENMRGRANDLVIIDEAGFIRELKALVHDVVIPSFLTTNGKLIAITTPPKAAGHYCAAMRQRLSLAGDFLKLRLSDNASITPEVRARWAAEAGGEDGPAFRREYECDEITDADAAVIPEWTEKAQAAIVQPVPPPDPYVARVVSMDLGWSDPTGILYGWYDFNSAHLMIQRESLLRRARIEEIARQVKQDEEELWGAHPPYSRISDIDPMVLAELSAQHGLHFRPVTKALKEQMVNELRTWVRQKRLRIDPCCKNLVVQMEAAIWTNTRKSFEKTEAFGHFDLVDSLIYLLTALPRAFNPYPSMPQGISHETHYIDPDAFPDRNNQDLRLLFRPAWRS